jgi:hypothetical protein
MTLLEDLGEDGDNFKIDLKEVGCEGVDWINLAEDKAYCQGLVDIVMNLWVP